MRRLSLIFAREKADLTRSDMVKKIKEKMGENSISENAYADIESGRRKRVEVELAYEIAKILDKKIEEIFLDNAA